MKRLVLTLLLLALPAVALAQKDSGPKSWNNPGTDIFHFRADTCPSTTATCGLLTSVPQRVIMAPNFVRGFVSIRVPTTQSYTLYYLAADIEGALNPATQVVVQGPFALNAGDNFTTSAQFSALGSGVYNFISIIVATDGKAAISEPYRFRYCNAACITGP